MYIDYNEEMAFSYRLAEYLSHTNDQLFHLTKDIKSDIVQDIRAKYLKYGNMSVAQRGVLAKELAK